LRAIDERPRSTSSPRRRAQCSSIGHRASGIGWVQLRYAAFPYQKFGLQQGAVLGISQSPLAPNQLPPSLAHLALADGAREALYRFTVSLAEQSIDAYGARQPLKAGMVVEADVIQDRRRIVEWILEPVIAVARRNER